MSEKSAKIVRYCAFALAIIMTALFSFSTVLMLQPKRGNDEGRLVQFSSSGGPVVELEKFEYINNTLKPGDKLEIEIDANFYNKTTSGKTINNNYHVDGFSISIDNLDDDSISIFGFYLSKKKDNVYEAYISDWLTPGTYKVDSLYVHSVNAYNNGYSYHRINADECRDNDSCENYKILQKTFTVTADGAEDKVPIYEYTIGFDKTDPEVYVGDKINLNIRKIDQFDEIKIDRKELKSMMLSFTNEKDNNVVNLYVKDIDTMDTRPAIYIPSTATAGKYNLNFGYLTFEDGTSERYVNTDTKTFSYNSSFIVKEKPMDTTKYYFNNEKYDDKISKDIDKLDDDAIITLDANNLTIIDEELFNKIKDTKRTLIIEYDTSRWVFSGADITNPKTIDVSILFSKLTDGNEYYNSFIKENVSGDAALLKFSDNGDLPGKVLIKIDKNSVDAILNNPNNVFVYYYKEDDDKLLKVAMEIQSNNGFYEFYINHNSKYIMTTEEVTTKAVSEEVDMLALNHQLVIQQQQLPIPYIIATVCGGLAIILLLGALIFKNRKQQQQQQQQQ